jgi:hypothetical protein
VGSARRRSRAAVEREFGRLKHEYGLTPLRVRGPTKGRASRRPHDARPLELGAGQGAGRSARRLSPPRWQRRADGESRVGEPLRRDHVSILWIIIIVIVVLAILGFFSRGRFSR